MPLYGYECQSCGNEFVEMRTISERNAPENEPCPVCSEVGQVKKQLSNARIVAGVGDFRAKVPDVFKDRLREIKKMSGKDNKIDV